MIWWILAAVLVVGLGVGTWFFGSAYWAAYWEVTNKPREPMMWCHKCGMIRQKHTIDLGYTQVCPICYKKVIGEAG